MKRGMLLIDRGSRERETSEELEVMCDRIKERGEYAFVDFCFLEVEPPYIEDGIARCLRKDIDSLTIVPYFLYPGRKVKIAVRDVMKFQKDTGIRFLVTRPMSMHKKLIDIVESRISTAIKENDIAMPKNEIDVMIIGHGSRDPNAHLSLNYILDGLRDSYRNVSRCWLEIEKPDIFDGVKRCEKDNPKVLIIVFYFLHEGAHVKTDINNELLPALKDSTIKRSFITRHIGTDPNIIDLIMERAGEVEHAD